MRTRARNTAPHHSRPRLSLNRSSRPRIATNGRRLPQWAPNNKFINKEVVQMRRFRTTAGLGLALLALSTTATLANDTLKVAVGQRGSWDTSVSELGQNAGIFKKHGLDLDL